MEDGLQSGGGVGHVANHIAAVKGQGDGAGQTCVPNDEAGVGRGDQQGIVHGGHTLCHFLSQQRTGDKAEAPVEPAADDGHEGGDDDSLHIVVSKTCQSTQRLLAGLGRGHGRAQHQHQCHLHREAQQRPEAGGGTPSADHVDGAETRGEHGGDKDHDGQDDGEQERIRQPSVDYANAAIDDFLKHENSLSS